MAIISSYELLGITWLMTLLNLWYSHHCTISREKTPCRCWVYCGGWWVSIYKTTGDIHIWFRWFGQDDSCYDNNQSISTTNWSSQSQASITVSQRFDVKVLIRDILLQIIQLVHHASTEVGKTSEDLTRLIGSFHAKALPLLKKLGVFVYRNLHLWDFWCRVSSES